MKITLSVDEGKEYLPFILINKLKPLGSIFKDVLLKFDDMSTFYEAVELCSDITSAFDIYVSAESKNELGDDNASLMVLIEKGIIELEIPKEQTEYIKLLETINRLNLIIMKCYLIVEIEKEANYYDPYDDTRRKPKVPDYSLIRISNDLSSDVENSIHTLYDYKKPDVKDYNIFETTDDNSMFI